MIEELSYRTGKFEFLFFLYIYIFYNFFLRSLFFVRRIGEVNL